MLKKINIFELLKEPDSLELAQRQLKEYKIHLLNEEAKASYHAKMVSYYQEGIKRLSNHTTTPH